MNSPPRQKVAAAPIVVGVALTWFGEMELSVAAAAVSISCVALNASKVVIYSEMLSGDYKVRNKVKYAIW